MQKARIKLNSPDAHQLNELTEEIITVSKENGAKIGGPIPLPTKTLEINTRKAPSGDGTATFERWEMRVHKRLIDIKESERALRQVMRVNVPKDVSIEVEIIE